MEDRRASRLLLILSSPTASGKTIASLEIAKQLSIEIISADSRQVYRYLDIGTAKPAKTVLSKIPHHFIDLLLPDEEWNAGIFANKTRELIPAIFKRERIPFVVGGTGLYIKALVDGIIDVPTPEPELRENLQARLNSEGLESLFRELEEKDPETASRIDWKNPRRVLRALEIHYLTGTSIEELKKQQENQLTYPILWFGLRWDRQSLYERIDRRVDEIISQGLVEEVEEILNMEYPKTLNALQTVGYKEVIDFLDGKMHRDEMISLIKQNTRRYAKRQMTWFRKEKRIRWIDIKNEPDLERAAEVIVKEYKGGDGFHNRLKM